MTTSGRQGRIGAGEITVGRDLGPVGRWVRVVSGLLALSYGIAGLVTGGATEPGHDEIGPPGTTTAQILQTVGFVAVLAGYYLLLHRLLGERLLARANPWFGTTIMLGSLGVFTAPFMPEPMHHAVGLYVGATVVLAAAIGYGGCEVVALPTLLTGRRYVVYCPWNAVDAAERPLHRLRIGVLGGLAAGLTVVVGVYFLLGRGLLARFDLPDPIAPAWALLLLLAPAALLIHHARAATERGEARVLGLGAAVLAVLALYFAELIPQSVVWPAVMLGGLLYATGRAITTLRRRTTARRAAPS